MGNVNMEAYQVHFEGKSVAEKLKELDETVKENEQEIDSLSDIVSIKADRIDIAPIFSEESAYSAGDLVYNSNSLWKFSVDHAAGDWDPSEVSAVNIDMELSELNNTLTRMLITDITTSITVSVTSFHVPIPSHNGYIPIAVVGFDKDNDTVPPYKMYLEVYNNEIQVYVAFPSTGGNIRFYILYAKNLIIS